MQRTETEVETTEKQEEKASEILARAAKLLNDVSKVYEANFELMKEQDALQQDLLHKLEIENLTRDERAKLAAELRDCRRLRRKYKDVVEELEPIAGYQREQKKLDEADRLNEESARLRQQAAELLTPYEGKSILDVPADVLDHASAILEEAQTLDKKWNRLMKL